MWRAGLATVFPQAIGMAAAWDPGLQFQIADVISTEARGKYNDDIKHDLRWRYHGLSSWSPNTNIFRDPRWGRGQETYGEDPFLTARLGVAFVKGLQGSDPKYFNLIATPLAHRSFRRLAKAVQSSSALMARVSSSSRWAAASRWPSGPARATLKLLS